MLAPNACADAARQRLQARGVEKFSRARLSQLYHALESPYSVWYGCSPEKKQEISDDVLSILGGNVDPLVTLASIAAVKAKAKKKPAKSTKTTTESVFEQVDDIRLRNILKEQIPHKPYCCDEFVSNAPRCLNHALKKRYIQLNPPGWYSFIIVDCDYPDAWNAWKNAGLPAPTWIVVNPENRHAHLVWAILKPVWAGGDNQKPARFFDAVQEGFRKVLHGDEGFAGLLTKNPIHPDWSTISESGFATYELTDLAKHVKPERPKKKRDGASIGRNCLVFDELRYWAYSAVKRFDDPLNFSMAVQAHAEKFNAALANPMASREVLHIARSVAKWVWAKFRCNNKDFVERQKKRGSLGGKAKGEANTEKRSKAIQMNQEGLSARKIAAALGVGKSSVYRWLRH